MTCHNGISKNISGSESLVEGDLNDCTCNRGCFDTSSPKTWNMTKKFFLVFTRHIKNGTEKEKPWRWCQRFSPNQVFTPIGIYPKQILYPFKSTKVGELPNFVPRSKADQSKRTLSLVVTHEDFKSYTDENLELHAVKKHFKVEQEGDLICSLRQW